MRFHRRDVVDALWALCLPFPIAAICTILTTAAIDHTSLMDLNQVPEETTTFGVTVLMVAYWAALLLSSAAGYVFARRLFVRHATMVAVVYFPLMCYVLTWFSFGVQVAVFGGP
jgi:hypothetical protein